MNPHTATFDELVDAFKNRTIKASSIFELREIKKNTAYDFIKKYHYLADAKFFSKFSFGLFLGGCLVGCATYTNPQGISTMKGWFGLPNTDQSVLELSRLCLTPALNNTNASSYLLSNSVKKLKPHGVRAVITLADSSRHSGSIYQVCNFTYYGLTDKKSDFFSVNGLNPRGSTKNVEGVWLPRTRKHRYAFILDKKLKCNYTPQTRPKKTSTPLDCCNGEGVVFDSRFKKTYVCPKCNDFKSLGLLDIYDLPSHV